MAAASVSCWSALVEEDDLRRADQRHRQIQPATHPTGVGDGHPVSATGLDPRSRRTVWEIVRSLASDGTAVFLTTQYLDEADQLADRVAILDRGRVVAQGTAQELKQRIPGGRIDLSFADAATQLAAAGAMQLPVRDNDALTLQVPTDGNVATLRGVLRELDAAGVDVVDLAIHTPDLDDVFLALTGQHDRSQKPRNEKEPQP